MDEEIKRARTVTREEKMNFELKKAEVEEALNKLKVGISAFIYEK